MTDGRFVTWDRWDAEHEALTRRVTVIERHLEQSQQQVSEARRARAWVLIGATLTGIVFPLMLSAVLTLIHLRHP